MAKIYAPILGRVIETPRFVVVDEDHDVVSRAITAPDIKRIWGVVEDAMSERTMEEAEKHTNVNNVPFCCTDEVHVPLAGRSTRFPGKSARKATAKAARASLNIGVPPQSGETGVGTATGANQP